MATRVTWTAPHAHAFLHPHSYTTLIGLLEQSEASSYVKQCVLRLLRCFVEAVARVHGVSEGGELALRRIAPAAALELFERLNHV